MNVPRELFNGYLDGALSDVEFDRLQTWIAADPAHAGAFLDWIATQGLVYESLRSDALEQVLALPAAEREGAEVASRNIAKPASSDDQRGILRFHRFWQAAAAAVVAAACWGAWELASRDPAAAPEGLVAARAESDAPSASGGDEQAVLESAAAEEANSDGDEVAATLTRLQKCVWRDPGTALTYGQRLAEGTVIALKSGIARVTFESGAEALIEGPCDFTVEGAMRGTIRSGRLSMSVPPRAYGFRIRSPSAEVIDLGTEFGVSVDEGGDSEVHVFKGKVLSRRLSAQGEQQGELFSLEANDALRFAAADVTASMMSSNEKMFVRAMTAQAPRRSRERLPVNDDLALWLAADMAVRTDRQKRVISWSDILYGDNRTAEDALQPEERSRPLLAPEAINGQPALRFNGSSSYLVTTPLETTDNQTIVLVCQFNPKALRPGRKRGGQIINYNGPPHRLLSNTFEPGVLQIGEPVVAGFAPTRIEGKRYAGTHQGVDVSESVIQSRPLGAKAPAIVAYRYDIDSHRATMWINGEKIGEEPALGPAGIVSRKVIGRHGFLQLYFDGDLSELLVYNQALPTERLAEVTRYLSEKYRISVDESSPVW